MTILQFPPLEFADRSGLIAIGGDFEIDSLLLAYRSGIFPWPTPDYPLAWFAPPKRAILSFDAYHPSTSFIRWLKKSNFSVTFDTAFADTMRGCAVGHTKPGEPPEMSTWITPEMIAAYTALHKAGYAHSCEVWAESTGVEDVPNGVQSRRLVGGIYGVGIGGMFAAESMFYTEPNVSKLALHRLIEKLAGSGITWIDVQVINPFTASLGAKEITRRKFMALLNVALAEPSAW